MIKIFVIRGHEMHFENQIRIAPRPARLDVYVACVYYLASLKNLNTF